MSMILDFETDNEDLLLEQQQQRTGEEI